MPEGSATRIGWGQEYANLQSPLGYDKFGYSWRSRKGTKFHESHGKHFSEGYGEGDTLGFLIVLPEIEGGKYTPNTFKDRPLVKVKSHLYYEDKDKISDTLKNLKVHPGSKIVLFKNGVCQGVAFENIYSGAYYPTISLHRGASVRLNFGVNGFKYPDILKEYNCSPVRTKFLLNESKLIFLSFRCAIASKPSFASRQWLTFSSSLKTMENCDFKDF